MAPTLYGLAAAGVALLHLASIAFAVAGAALLPRWPALVVLHAPAVAWAAWISFSGGVCPLTPLENRFRALAGQDSYAGGFVEHYLWPLIYPAGLTPGWQVVLGGAVLAINVGSYAAWWRGRRRRSAQRDGSCPPA